MTLVKRDKHNTIIHYIRDKRENSPQHQNNHNSRIEIRENQRHSVGNTRIRDKRELNIWKQKNRDKRTEQSVPETQE